MATGNELLYECIPKKRKIKKRVNMEREESGYGKKHTMKENKSPDSLAVAQAYRTRISLLPEALNEHK